VDHALTQEDLEPLIHAIRGQRVVLDADLARLYGVGTKALNQAVKRIVTANPQASESIAKSGNRSQIVTGSQRHRDKRSLPWAFTEHGSLMAANVLRSDDAARMSVFIVRAFIRLREHVAANTAVMARLAEIDKALLQHDAALRDLYRKLLPLLQPPADPPKRRIGFHPEDQ
jgi:hypothetical protein